MKTLFLTLAAFAATTLQISISQENEISNTGNVGIGTTDPSAKLDVKGNVKIDSVLTVKDSANFEGVMTMREDASATRDFTVEGTTTLNGEVNITNGAFRLNYLTDPDAEGDRILLIRENGEVRDGDLLSAVYEDKERECRDGNGGYTTPENPTWANKPGALYATLHCVPDVKVGIGTSDPTAKLHIKLNNEIDGIDTHPILVQQADGRKILQLTEDGLLQAREIKVDVASWPDYVFDDHYSLLSFDELAEYIRINNHLPNIPTACDLETNGVNISETTVLLMEKIEELTLYMLELEKEIEALKAKSTAKQ